MDKHDIVELMEPRPWWSTTLRGVMYGVAVAVVAIAALWGFSRLTGTPTLADLTDRNAEISVASSKALRCVLTIRPDPERSFEDTQKLIDRCYAQFDELVGTAAYDIGEGETP